MLGGAVPIAAMNFKSMEGRRFQDRPNAKQIRVDHNSTLTLVQKIADDRTRIEFAFTTSYGPIGMVKVEGTLIYQSEDAQALVDEWDKNRNLPPANAQEVHGAILNAAIPEAVGLAKGVRLPPPLPIPQVRFGQQGNTATAGIGEAGPDHGPDAA